MTIVWYQCIAMSGIFFVYRCKANRCNGAIGAQCLNTILFLGHSYIFVIISYLVTTYMQNPAPKHAEKVDFSLYTNIYEPSENKMNVNPAFWVSCKGNTGTWVWGNRFVVDIFFSSQFVQLAIVKFEVSVQWYAHFFWNCFVTNETNTPVFEKNYYFKFLDFFYTINYTQRSLLPSITFEYFYISLY